MLFISPEVLGPCIARWILNHVTTRKVPHTCIFLFLLEITENGHSHEKQPKKGYLSIYPYKCQKHEIKQANKNQCPVWPFLTPTWLLYVDLFSLDYVLSLCINFECNYKVNLLFWSETIICCIKEKNSGLANHSMTYY